jgi:hypothetical protein
MKSFKSKIPESYDVGYGKPPKDHRFKPGQSGNPNGRPVGSLNVGTVLVRILRERLTIVENGRRKTITKLETMLKQLVNQAATGDLRALKLFITLARAVEDQLDRLSSESKPAPIQIVLSEIEKNL